MTRSLSALSVAIACGIAGSPLFGCMAFQSNSAREFSNFPPAEVRPVDHTVKLNLDTTFQIVGMSTTNDFRQSAVDNINGWAEDIFEETGVFSIQPDAGTSDYRLVIRVRNDANPNIGMAVLTGLTLYIVPSKSTDSFTTDMELIDLSGKQVSQKTYRHSVTLWQQLFLVFGAPFATLRSVEAQMWQDVLQDAAVWAASGVGS